MSRRVRHGTMEAYSVVKRIGSGSYGSAYLVSLRTNPSIQFVLKKVRLDEVSEKEREAAEQEVELLETLDHPFILSYVESFIYKKHLCIITEYCEAGDMYSYLKARKTLLPEAQILEWFVQIALAIHHCHEHRVLHRDLKTQNVFLTKYGDVKLGDFGIARVLNGPMEMAKTIIGTPYYMSPEILECKPYDYKSDIWSLGCVLYELATQKQAFDAADMNGLVMKVLRGKIVPLPDHYSLQLGQMINRMLSKSPRGRPSLEMIFSAEFMQAIYQKTVSKVAQLQVARGRPPALEPVPIHDRDLRAQLEAELKREIEERRTLESTMANLKARRQPVDDPVVGHLLARAGGKAQTGAARAGYSGKHGPFADTGVTVSSGGATGNVLAANREAQTDVLDGAVGLAEERLRRIQEERDEIRVRAMRLDGAPGGILASDQTPVDRGLDTTMAQTFGGDGSLSQYIASDEPTPKAEGNDHHRYWHNYTEGTRAISGAQLSTSSRYPVAGRRFISVEEAHSSTMEAMPALDMKAELARAWGPFDDAIPLHHIIGVQDAWSKQVGLEAELEEHRTRRRQGITQLSPSAVTSKGYLLHHRPQRSPSLEETGNRDLASSSQGKELHLSEEDLDRLPPKERMEARKLLEAQRREAQLLSARKKYFEERRQAEKKNREIEQFYRAITESVFFHAFWQKMINPFTDVELDNLKTQHLALSMRIWDLEKEVGGLSHVNEHERQGSGAGYQPDPLALVDFEAEIEAPDASMDSPELLPTRSFVRGQVLDRVTALRQMCSQNLGNLQFQQVYRLMRGQINGDFGDNPTEELMDEVARLLGPQKLHYIGLIDQLIYFEDSM